MKIKIIYLLSILIPILILAYANTVHASVIDNLKNRIIKAYEDVLRKKEVSIISDISLAPDGDLNSNGEIEAGDVVRFTFTLTNTTGETYTYSSLKTNVDRKQLNFIHSLRGATGLSDEDGTIIFRNLRINPNEQRVISFDARINYSREDKNVATEPEFITEDQKLILKADKKSVLAKKLNDEEIKKRLENRGVVSKEKKND